MELAYLRILADAVDPGIGGLNDDPMMVAVFQFLNDSTDGVVLNPSGFAITLASPPSHIDTQLLVVPKSIPIILLIFNHLSLHLL